MYDKIEQMYKKESAYIKFFRINFGIALGLYLLFWVLGLLEIDNIISFLIYFVILILTNYIFMLHTLGYNLKQYKQFLKFNKNINLYKKYLKNTDKILIKKILSNIKITEKEDIKIIIDHYRGLSAEQKQHNNYISIIAFIVAVFSEFKDIFKDQGIEEINILSFFVTLLFSTSLLYFCFKCIIYIIDVLSGNKDLYKNLEELITEEYFNY